MAVYAACDELVGICNILRLCCGYISQLFFCLLRPLPLFVQIYLEPIDQAEPCFITNVSAYTHQQAHLINAIRGNSDNADDIVVVVSLCPASDILLKRGAQATNFILSSPRPSSSSHLISLHQENPGLFILHQRIVWSTMSDQKIQNGALVFHHWDSEPSQSLILDDM
jgi:hypothetical protein